MQSIFVLIFCAALASALRAPMRSKFMTSRNQLKQMMHPSDAMDITQSFLTAVTVEAKPDNYVYGAVNAPSWALPLGAVLAIITAAIPILLRPGEKALDQQRLDEEQTNNTFNKRRGKDL